MSVEFTKNQKNNTVACYEGHSYFYAKPSKRDPTLRFYTCEMYYDKDIKCRARVILTLQLNYYFSLQLLNFYVYYTKTFSRKFL